MIRVGFTGTQQGMTDEQKAAVDHLMGLLTTDAVEVHHGDCVGADADMHDIAENYCADVVIHPPDNDSKRAFCTGGEMREPKPYLARNRDIVDETEVLIACPYGEERQRSGTWSTVRYARSKIYDAKRQKIFIITPHGTIIREGG
jgi:hypothetical protein